MLERSAPAKINLALHVTGQHDDGYHELDSLVVFTEYGDKIFVDTPHHAHGPVSISVDGPFGEGLSSGPENLVTAATFLLRDAIIKDGGDPVPVMIHLEKNLPVASGIGGGSADAAAVLLALQETWQSNIDLLPIAKSLGADVPMCLVSKPLRATGTGESITLIELKEALPMVLVNPGIAVSTPDVFKALASKNNTGMGTVPSGQSAEVLAALEGLRNDLQKPAIGICPVVADVLESLSSNGAKLARMSGSGATCFGIFASMDDAKAASETIKAKQPGWWCIATRSIVT